MEHMREIAFATVLRACAFGSLAIFCVMIGLSFEPRAAFQAGGFLTTLMTGEAKDERPSQPTPDASAALAAMESRLERRHPSSEIITTSA